ncbi:hypothetical protein BD311DRAFT_743838, partial [Dichomitus squalens]
PFKLLMPPSLVYVLRRISALLLQLPMFSCPSLLAHCIFGTAYLCPVFGRCLLVSCAIRCASSYSIPAHVPFARPGPVQSLLCILHAPLP